MIVNTANTRASRTRAHQSHRAQWLVPVGLIILSLIPVLAGAVRLAEVTGGAVPTVHNARFLDSPVPVILHIVSVTIYTLLGAFQFVPRLRRRGGWHSVAGRVLIPAGLVSALSGIWMAGFYPHAPGDGLAIQILRLVFGSGMVAAIILGVRAAMHRKFAVHGEWMTRAYAIGIGAGTQAIVLIPGAMIFGPTHELSRTILMGAAWVINLAIAEVIMRVRPGS